MFWVLRVLTRKHAPTFSLPSLSSLLKYVSYVITYAIGPLTCHYKSRARAKSYVSNQAFDKEMAQLFEKARRWHEAGGEAYGRILLLQVGGIISTPYPF